MEHAVCRSVASTIYLRERESDFHGEWGNLWMESEARWVHGDWGCWRRLPFLLQRRFMVSHDAGGERAPALTRCGKKGKGHAQTHTRDSLLWCALCFLTPSVVWRAREGGSAGGNKFGAPKRPRMINKFIDAVRAAKSVRAAQKDATLCEREG